MPIVILAVLVLGARAGPPGLSLGPSLNPQLDADLDDEVALMPLASNPGEHLVVDAETGGYSHIRLKAILNFFNLQAQNAFEFALPLPASSWSWAPRPSSKS